MTTSRFSRLLTKAAEKLRLAGFSGWEFSTEQQSRLWWIVRRDADAPIYRFLQEFTDEGVANDTYKEISRLNPDARLRLLEVQISVIHEQD